MFLTTAQVADIKKYARDQFFVLVLQYVATSHSGVVVACHLNTIRYYQKAMEEHFITHR